MRKGRGRGSRQQQLQQRGGGQQERAIHLGRFVCQATLGQSSRPWEEEEEVPTASGDSCSAPLTLWGGVEPCWQQGGEVEGLLEGQPCLVSARKGLLGRIAFKGRLQLSASMLRCSRHCTARPGQNLAPKSGGVGDPKDPERPGGIH